MVAFPLPGSIFGCSPADLHDMAAGPALLMLSSTPIQVYSDAAVNNSVPDFEVVLVAVSWFSHRAYLLSRRN